MKIIKPATAGTLESSDAYVQIEPCESGLILELESVVLAQFGEAIEEAVRDVAAELEVQNAKIRVMDRGALECVLKARVETALLRGRGDR